ncbi:MAG: RNA polymerase sigma factor [Terriglobia bacterium]
MATQASDTELMLKVKAGDREAFTELVRRYRKPLINFIFRFTGNSGEAEELTQDVFVKVFQSAPKYEAKAAFSTWLYRIATHCALNAIRDRKSHLMHSIEMETEESGKMLVTQLADGKPLTEEHLLQEEKLVCIRKAIFSLPENQRLAVLLMKYQDLSLKETAEVLKCSETAVKSLIFRAYATLRQKLLVVIETRP